MLRTRPLIASLLIAASMPLTAQSYNADLHRDVGDVQKKLIALAGAMPENTLDWRPKSDPKVRSVREVFTHVIAENYYLPGLMGKAAPAASGITSDYKSVEAYEKKTLTQAEIVAALTASFGNLHQGLNTTTDANAGEKINFFGQQMTRSSTMVSTVTHLHEHLGQAIAYARSNGVVPPWSK